MKIDIISIDFYPYMGIDRSALIELSAGLVKRGHDVMVHTTPYLLNRSWKLPAEDNVAGVKVRIYRLYPGYIFFPHVRDSDVVHLYRFGGLYFYIQSFLHSREKLITTLVGEEVISYHKLRNKLFGHLILNRARKIIAVNAKEANFLHDIYKIDMEKIEIIWDVGVPESSLREPSDNFPEIDLVRRLLTKTYFIRVARIVPFKEIEFGIKLVSKMEGVYFVVVGPPENRGYYEQLKRIARELNVSDRVIFTGSVSRDAKISLLRNARFYLLNNNEASGVATIEAMAQGVPVLGIYYDQYNDILKDSNSIRFRTLEDALAKANLLIKDSGLAQSLGRAGMKEVREELCFERTLDHFERIYKEVLGL